MSYVDQENVALSFPEDKRGIMIPRVNVYFWRQPDRKPVWVIFVKTAPQYKKESSGLRAEPA